MKEPNSQEVRSIILRLESMANKKHVDGMERFGIVADKALGIRAPQLKALAREIGKNHKLAIGLWNTGIHEARELAYLIADPKQIDAAFMEAWLLDINSWDLCDGCCMHLFRKTEYAYAMIEAWRHRDEMFVKRAAFVMIATLAVHDKKQPDDVFEAMLPHIVEAADDDRNFVKKAVNWALRQIGKRNMFLNEKAIITAEQLVSMPASSAVWIGRDALRELRSDKIQRRVSDRKKR